MSRLQRDARLVIDKAIYLMPVKDANAAMFFFVRTDYFLVDLSRMMA